MRSGVGVVSPGVVSAPRSHRRRRHVRRCAVLEEGPELGAMGGCVVCAAAEGRGTQGASRWFSGLLTGIINYLASSQQKQQIIEQNGGRRRSSAPASLLRPSPNAAHGAGFGLARTVALAHLGSGTLPRTGAVPGPCLEMANMEQSTTAALLLLIKNPRHQAAQHKTALLLRVATHQCRCVHVRSRLSTSRRCGFDCSRAIEGAGARHEDSDETQDHTPVA